LRDKVDANRQVQKITIEGLQSNLTIDVEAKEVAIEELKSNLTRKAKMQQVNMVQL
jgi:hypothetical protein